MVKLSIKKRDENGQWKELLVSDLAGKTLRQFFSESQSQEIVVEFDFDGTKCYFAGTDHWIERMNKKGRAISFAGAIDRLEKIRPRLLDDWLPDLGQVDDVFEGATVEQIKEISSVK
jgi:hypothetical protein